MAPRVMIYCPLAPETPGIQPQTLSSIFALDWPDPAEIVFGKEDLDGHPGWVKGNQNITRKYNQAREMALSGGYDALLTIEADMIVPRQTLKRLAGVEADVAYGLYVSRHGRHPWLAFSEITPEIRGSASMGETWQERERLWGQVVETRGVGMGCTLIWRHVLEAIEFRVLDEMVANDWYFSVDLQERGFVQKHDCGVVCGHMEGYLTYWPDIAHGYRVDEPAQPIIQELIDMAQGKYVVISTLSLADRFAYPGEEVELEESIASILLKKKVIKPADRQPSAQVEVEARVQEVKHGTDN